MHDHLILLVVGVPLLLALCTYCALAALAAAKAADAIEDATYAQLRTPGMGDLRSVPETDDAA